MLGAIKSEIRDIKAASISFVLVLGAAIIGLVWLSIAAVMAIRPYVPQGSAAAIIGAIGLLPLLLSMLVGFIKRAAKREKREPPALSHMLSGPAPELSNITRVAERWATRNPLYAILIATIAGVLASRFPFALALFAQILLDMDERGSST